MSPRAGGLWRFPSASSGPHPSATLRGPRSRPWASCPHKLPVPMGTYDLQRACPEPPGPLEGNHLNSPSPNVPPSWGPAPQSLPSGTRFNSSTPQGPLGTKLRFSRIHQKQIKKPWLVWLGGQSVGLQTKGSGVRFRSRAHAQVAGSIPSGGHAGGSQLMILSHH
uniref:Uncharacterized protein n=1 Tax=Myotis myotis TaxID=51298 RepID=A0A7J7VZA6_MYOMY|nr:hypothetical protein mMyoMyo1_012383 [Myotis myotis]